MQNCTPIYYLQIVSKVLMAMEPMFFFNFSFYLFRSFVSILVVAVNFLPELWLFYQSYLCIFLNHNLMALNNRNEIQIPS